MKLMIVESPTKAKAIQGYLSEEWKVVASKGHIREIRKVPFGVDLDNNFEIHYEYVKNAETRVKELKSLAENADTVILASDPDREGEAIAWHLADELGINPESPCRITYQEVSKDAVLNALKDPRPIDIGLVDAARARSAMDYITGFKVSPVLWKHYANALSAGRVQSVVLDLINQREREIKAFVPEEYWTLEAKLIHEGMPLFVHYAKDLKNEAEADGLKKDLSGREFRVNEIKKKTVTVSPKDAFTTSTLQQTAASRLNFDVDRTMSIAQKLFEGKQLPNGEVRGLITYMRTDSKRVSAQAQLDAQAHITEVFGKEYAKSVEERVESDAMVQDAHEAIRPTDVKLTPSIVAPALSEEENRLYELIYSRFLASRMEKARSERTTVEFIARGISGEDIRFSASATREEFAGFRAADRFNEIADDAEETENEHDESSKSVLLSLKESESLLADEIIAEQHFKKGPARFNQASMVRQMELSGIGRPSTYAAMVKTVKQHGYVEQDNKQLAPRPLGVIVGEGLAKSFGDRFHAEPIPEKEDTEKRRYRADFTMNMEKELDRVAHGEATYLGAMNDFWAGLGPALEHADETMPYFESEESDYFCPVCGAKLIKRLAKGGVFYGCGNFPVCNYTWSDDEISDRLCPVCKEPMAKRHKTNGTVFYTCVNGACANGQKTDKPAPLKEKPEHVSLSVLPWTKKILTTKTPATARKLANRIKKVAPEDTVYALINGDRLSKALADPSVGLLVLKEDAYGNKRFLPTEYGNENGVETGETTLGGKKAEIAMFEKNAQQVVIRKLAGIEQLLAEKKTEKK